MASREQICIDPLPIGVTPARSCGPLGCNDAADPNALACMPGDTPGPLGSGYDHGDTSAPPEPNTCQSEVPVLAVDMQKMRRILYAVAYAEAANDAATPGFWSSDIDLGDQKKVEASASARADTLMDELLAAMASGPEAFQSFIEAQEKRKHAAAASLKGKLDKALQAGRKADERWGTAIRVCAAVKFVSTVTVKTLGVFTGWGGSGIDLVYTVATDAANPVKPKGILAVSKDAAKSEAIEWLNDFIAEKGLMTEMERKQVQSWLGNYEGNAKKIDEQLKKIEQRLLKQMEKGKDVSRIVADRAKKLDKLRRLRAQTVGSKVLRSAGPYKKALGATASFVFLAQDVSEAWSQFELEYAMAGQ